MVAPVIEGSAATPETAAGSTHDANIPSGVTSGELLAYFYSSTSVDRHLLTPVGWDGEFHGDGYFLRTGVVFKQADGTETGTETFSYNSGTSAAGGVMVRISGFDTADPFNSENHVAGDSGSSIDPWTLSANVITGLISDSLLIVNWGTASATRPIVELDAGLTLINSAEAGASGYTHHCTYEPSHGSGNAAYSTDMSGSRQYSHLLAEVKAAVADGQTISGTVGEIATGEAVPSQTIALSARQALSGTVGEIATAESVPTDAVISDVVLAITGEVGEIASAESVPTDAVIADVTLDITGTVGEIATAEAFPTDAIINVPGQAITGPVGEISTAESVPSQTIANAPPQAITGTVGEIATGFASPSQTIALSTPQAISGTVGEISSAESVPNDAIISDVPLALLAAGAIASAENIPQPSIAIEGTGQIARRPLGIGLGIGF